MAVRITPKYLEDKVIFHYEIGQCPGVPNEGGKFGKRCIEVPYYHVHRLPLLPKEVGGDIKEFYIPKTRQTIAFIIYSWPETGAGGRMFDLSGPYYKPN